MEFKLNKDEQVLFDALGSSESGRQLCLFIERLSQHLCDVRNVEPTPENIKAVQIAVRILDEEIVKRITLSDKRQDVLGNKEFV